ncbi:MAG: hypothetical protein M1816_000328 [Peltula sp. TS41687]|nr:MAG: hypothetical protein M1816_000328 [Peltula sp. TS41687]
MSRFYFGGSDTSSDVDDDDNLPYPTPLPRSSFLTPDFSPVTYLSTLHNRHQTLEDLRSELRSRSRDLSKELLDLLNTNYQDFLSLGVSLHGGEEKVDEVKVGLLGFQKELQKVKEMVSKREREMRGLLAERRAVTKQIWLGRNLLELDGRLEDIEARLMVDGTKVRDEDGEEDDWDVSDTDDEEDDDEDDIQGNDGAGGATFMSLSRLQKLVRDYLYIKYLASAVGADHPYVLAQKSRIASVHDTLLLDLSAALKQTIVVGSVGKDRLVKMMGLYREMDEANEAIRVLRASKR